MGEEIAVIGAGSWGTALAKLLAEKGKRVLLWAYESEVARGIVRNHRNPLFLSDILLPQQLTATSDLEEALIHATIVISVVPSHALRSVWKKGGRWLSPSAVLVSCTKGIENDSLKLTSQVLDESLPKHPAKLRAVLSGPSFAREVARGLPTSVVIAGKESKTTTQLQQLFRTPVFLPFTSSDIVGVQVGGAVKNVIAIAAGVSDGLQLGHNARAAIITRGVYEMTKVGIHLGAKPMTFSGLSGLGDLVLTCTDEQSRNFSVGKAIGEGGRGDEVLADTHMVAEGTKTASALWALQQKHGLNLPICNAVYRILRGEIQPLEAVKELTSLPLREEMGGLDLSHE